MVFVWVFFRPALRVRSRCVCLQKQGGSQQFARFAPPVPVLAARHRCHPPPCRRSRHLTCGDTETRDGFRQEALSRGFRQYYRPGIQHSLSERSRSLVLPGRFPPTSLLGVHTTFQIARGLVLPLTILVSSVHTRSTPTSRTLAAAGVVTIGFLVGVAPSTSVPAISTPSTLSLSYGFLSSLFIAFHAVLIKSSLPHCNNSTIVLAYWTNLGSAALLLPFVPLHGELAVLEDLIHTSSWDGNVFLWGSLITGVFGFLLCLAGLLSIKVTSPITHMFSSVSLPPV